MLYEITIPQFIKMLGNLNNLLTKAEQYAQTKKFDTEVLAQSRLAPDQFNFIRQVQIACDTAKLAASRLTGKEAPQHPDTEKTFTELKERITSTIAYLKDFTEKDFVSAPEKAISQPRWEGKYLTGTEFTYQHALPNLYFHITTAYAILRHNGVDVGKKDYLGPMPYKT
ncbi:MAG: DUF1993 domain-containing protein [Bdellovibrionota bacterium]